MLKFYNTLTRKKEVFKPIKDKKVGLYTCGPTVYWYAHIGNFRTYIFEDILRRVLEYNGYKVNHIMNITDVGHLTSNADTGEDKLEIGAKRERKTAKEIAEFYTRAFKNDLKRLNIQPPNFWAKASDYIKEQINLIRILEKKEFTYKIQDGVYFDTSKLKNYGKLAGLKKIKIKAGARVEMAVGKKNPTDFALWKLTPSGIKRQQEWNSPWGKGFPGWHTECVAMSIKYLGIPFDIHTGGIDHIPIHHTNEIAQAEAAFGKILANFWLHGEFLTFEGGKMAKSEGNILTIQELIDKGFSPLAYRYLCLTTHYRSKLSFSLESLEAAKIALENLYQKIIELKSDNQKKKFVSEKNKNYQEKFLDFINDDLNIPQALALTWNLLKDTEISPKYKYKILIDFDKIFGLNLNRVKETKIPNSVKELVELRKKYRSQNNWQKSDEVRKEIKNLGWWVEDTTEGPKLKKL